MNSSKFPIIFGRKGGAFEFFNKAYFDYSFIETISSLSDLEKELVNKKKDFINILTLEIKANQGKNSKLLNLKRDVYNDRNLKKYQKIESLKERIKKDISDLDSIKYKFEQEFKIFSDLFMLTLQKSINNLNEIIHQPFFKNGLLFASHILYNEINKTNFDFPYLNKKNKRLIISVLKYLTRSTTKTTPFSSFNNLFFLQQNINGNYHSSKNQIQSYFQVNNLFFYYLKEILLNINEFKNNLILHINTTLWEEQNSKEWHFFVNHNNDESFKKFACSPILEFIRKEITQTDCTYNELVLLIANETSETISNVAQFINKLVAEGFIKLIFPVTVSQKNWVLDLKVYLKQNDLEKRFQSFIDMLEMLNNTLIEMKSLDIDRRKDIIELSYKNIVHTFQLFDESNEFTKKVKPQDLYYEDTLQHIDSLISKSTYTNVEFSLKEVFYNLNNLFYKKSIKEHFSKILTSNFDGKLPLLKFYEGIYLKNLKEQSFQEKSLATIRNIISSVQKIKENDLQVEFIDLKQQFTSIDLKVDTRPFGAYIQTTDKDFSKIILNGFSNGYGANCSRFFNVCSNEQVKQIKFFNENNQKIIADVKDASLHNTNNYPALTDCVISVCDDQNLKRDHTLLNLSDLYVIADANKSIILVNKEKKEIIPISFSLEGMNRKSKFTQFLDIFNPNENIGYSILLENINKLYKKDLNMKSVVTVPRLCFGHTIIIQRKKWLIKKNVLTDIIYNTQENSLSKVFYKLNKWKQKYDIPDEVFIKIGSQDFKNPQNDNYKPQYIHFGIPVFVLLLQNILKKSDEIIELSEMQPSSENVLNNGGFVKEYILNITN